MPRQAAAKGGGGAGAGKGARGYQMPERLPKGLQLAAVGGAKWRLGAPIAKGGFGEIYAAAPFTPTSNSNSPKSNSTATSESHVVKIEPHGNGPLFVEMHFYMRNSKKEDIEEFTKAHKLKYLGIPVYIGSGSHEYNNTKYRFVVMERYGKDLWHKFLECGRQFPTHTVFRIAIQMLNAYEYIHSRTYVHADLKGGNILFGLKKGVENQTYLVDFGLASHYTVKDYKFDPKKAHNGTIEYTSRDAHNGVPTRRGDMEILAYNLVQWLTGSLPWETDLRHPKEVHAQKEKYMSDIPGFLKKTFTKSAPPHAITSYLNYVSKMEYNDEPDYKACRTIFESGIKTLGFSNTGILDFTPEKSGKAKFETKDLSDLENEAVLETQVVKTTRKKKLLPKSALEEAPVKTVTKKTVKTSSKKVKVENGNVTNTSNSDIGDVSNVSFNTTISLRPRRVAATPTTPKDLDCSVDIFEDSCMETPPKLGLKRKHRKRFEVEYCTDEEVTVHTTVKKKGGVVKEETKSWKKCPAIVNGKIVKKVKTG
ncbi:nucleosomal histone kinase 1 [Arctopsyche grandis]|uniref:nucleosomal histone kinase 1 n=1 Tax=Arctopsyche grandis TaxID=121162 RepID=UPI00406D9D65